MEGATMPGEIVVRHMETASEMDFSILRRRGNADEGGDA